MEEYINAAKRRNGLKVVHLRMCTAVGPSYFKKGGVVKVLAKSPLGILIGGKDTALQFIHEEDVKNLVWLVLQDRKVEGTFNLASDSYAFTKELNSKKLFLSVPKPLFRVAISLLWRLRLSGISPTSVDLIAHGIVASPEKIKKRYGYHFCYSTKQAYIKTVEERRKNGTL